MKKSGIKQMKKICLAAGVALLLAAALLFGNVPAMAASDDASESSTVQQIDPDRTDCSITLNMEYEENGTKKPMTSGEVSLYTVASVKVEEGFWFDTSTGKFAGVKDIDAISQMDEETLDKQNEAVAKRLAAVAKNPSAEILADKTVSIKDGKAAFTGLKPGLYLIVQTKEADNSLTTNPFLISIPYTDGSYQVEADPKPSLPSDNTQPEGKKTSDKPSPKGDKIPQTGQLWWPVPFVAGAGAVLLVAGGLIRRRAKSLG